MFFLNQVCHLSRLKPNFKSKIILNQKMYAVQNTETYSVSNL